MLFGVPFGEPSSSSGSRRRPKPAKRNGARQAGTAMERRRNLELVVMIALLPKDVSCFS